MDSIPEAWRKVWREGVAPQLSMKALGALADALQKNDPALIQNATTTPPPLAATKDMPCEGACAVALAGWKGEGLATVGEVEEFFALVSHRVDELVGGEAEIRWLLNWFDDSPRATAFKELLGEVKRTLTERTRPENKPAA